MHVTTCDKQSIKHVRSMQVVGRLKLKLDSGPRWVMVSIALSWVSALGGGDRAFIPESYTCKVHPERRVCLVRNTDSMRMNFILLWSAINLEMKGINYYQTNRSF